MRPHASQQPTQPTWWSDTEPQTQVGDQWHQRLDHCSTPLVTAATAWRLPRAHIHHTPTQTTEALHASPARAGASGSRRFHNLNGHDRVLQRRRRLTPPPLPATRTHRCGLGGSDASSASSGSSGSISTDCAGVATGSCGDGVRAARPLAFLATAAISFNGRGQRPASTPQSRSRHPPRDVVKPRENVSDYRDFARGVQRGRQ